MYDILDALINLDTPGKVHFKSDATLVTEVSKHLDPDAKNIVAAKMPTLPLVTTPLAALHELGRVSAMKPSTPLGILRSLAPLFFYLGILTCDPKNGNLHLSRESKEWFRGNERRKLSEDIGTAFGIIVGKQWCLQNKQGAHASAILISRRHLLPAGHQLIEKREPDILLEVTSTGPSISRKYYLLETKGRSGHDFAVPLAHAASQLYSFTINNIHLPSLATCTAAELDGITVYAIDPNEEPFTSIDDPDLLFPWHRDQTSPPQEPWPSAWFDSTEERYRSPEEISRYVNEQILRRKYESILALGGASHGSPLNQTQDRRYHMVSIRRFSSSHFDWHGYELSLWSQQIGAPIILRLGVEQGVLNAVQTGPLSRVREAENSYRRRLEATNTAPQIERAQPVQEISDEDFVYDLSTDGTIFGIGIPRCRHFECYHPRFWH